jgi:hypothetical protein
VQSITPQAHPEGVLVYNFEVEDDHTYFVGTANGGTWVHNTCWEFNPAVDTDLRGSGKGATEALKMAFGKTGLRQEEFQVTRWGTDVYGKTHPVEWRHPSGAEVNIDFAHTNAGPGVPHVGWQTAGKRASGGASRGHILLDEVPRGR